MTLIEVTAGGIEALQREVLVLRWCLGVMFAFWLFTFLLFLRERGIRLMEKEKVMRL